jgi:hypothetical protein
MIAFIFKSPFADLTLTILLTGASGKRQDSRLGAKASTSAQNSRLDVISFNETVRIVWLEGSIAGILIPVALSTEFMRLKKLRTSFLLVLLASSIALGPCARAAVTPPANGTAVDDRSADQSDTKASPGDSRATKPSADGGQLIDDSFNAADLKIPPKRSSTKSVLTPPATFRVLTDPYSDEVSTNAQQVIKILFLNDKLKQLHDLQQQAKALNGQKLPLELRQDIADLKIEVLETIEQARLEIDFLVAEIEVEQASAEELLQAYTTERDNRVNRANLNAFRTNGVLWAVAEALDIPTYSHPRYSISSGTIGIAAGLVPSIFSAYAVHSLGGKKYEREPYPNVLCKIYGFPVLPAINYPDSVWRYLNTVPPGETTKTRRDLLISHWVQDRNIHIFDHGITKTELTLLVGIDQSKVSIDLLTDRLTMVREVKAFALQMSRALLEINMIVREKKHLPVKS